MSKLLSQESSSTGLHLAIGSDTTTISVVDLRVADAIFQAESSSKCDIREGVFIPRHSPNTSARVIRPFSIQLIPTEDGYIAVSDLCNITELENTIGEVVRSYLYSLVDELLWLQKHTEDLSKPLRDELIRIKSYIQIV